MNECEKIESLLWESLDRTLTGDEKRYLDKHLSECAKCRAVKATIDAISISRDFDKDTIADIDADEFENSVIQKIRTRESEIRFKREDRGYMVRLYFSVGLAAAIVGFMVLSMGDLERYILPIRSPVYRSAEPGKRYDTLHITLQPQQQQERKGETPALKTPEPDQLENKAGMIGRDSEMAVEKKAFKIMPPPVLGKSSDSVAHMPSGMASIEEKGSPSEKRTLPYYDKKDGQVMAEEKTPPDLTENYSEPLSKKLKYYAGAAKSGPSPVQTEADFSILSKPVTNPAPDSVIISSIYLSDESIPMATQQTRAYLPEVIIDSGMVRSRETPRSVLVTVDKMPVPVKIIAPEYPVWAKKNGISGVVWIKARVDKEGKVTSAEVLSSSMPGYGFEEASLEAAKQCEYIPAETNGYKIDISVLYPVKFIFKNKDGEQN